MTEEDDQLSRLYHSAEKPGSPREVDEAVLNMAADLAPQRAQRYPQWLPLASAASIIGLTILLLFPAGNTPPTVSGMEELQLDVDALMDSADEIAPEQMMGISSGYSAAESSAKTLMKSATRKRESLETSADMETPANMTIRDVGRAEMESAAAPPVLEESFAEPLDDHTVSAQQWLDNIQALLASNDPERAMRQFRIFRDLYPDFPVPPELALKLTEAESGLIAPTD
jgi:hypothetical protein